jgi:competence protein ComEA
MAEIEEIDVKLTKKDAEKGELIDLEGKFDIDKFLMKYKIPVGIGLVGLVLIGIGSLAYFKMFQPQEKIEIISGEEEETGKSIFCDIAGGVEKPGMYELPSGSRVEELLIEAGGLSGEADREWVEKNLNRAQKLVDGTKIYIPIQSERVKEQESEKVAGSLEVMAKININTASASELDTLWGIGTARAQAIIDNRPYQSIEELENKKIIPSNVYEEIKDQISVY